MQKGSPLCAFFSSRLGFDFFLRMCIEQLLRVALLKTFKTALEQLVGPAIEKAISMLELRNAVRGEL